MRGCFPLLSEATQEKLAADFTLEDTKKVVMKMGLLKAPRLDDFQLVFFKKMWEKTCQPLHKISSDILEGGRTLSEATEVLLVLSPKEEQPSNIISFRPISLCNVTVKVISRIIVDRLKGILGEIISPNQASFIPGRQSCDNFIICQELVHSMNYTKERRGGMIIKLDLEKVCEG